MDQELTCINCRLGIKLFIGHKFKAKVDYSNLGRNTR